MVPQFYNRDLSWLSFNERILMEAERSQVPLLERIRFLSIYSSNLDEFYRVRMPVMNAMHQLAGPKHSNEDKAHRAAIVTAAQQMIAQQLSRFGRVFTQELLPALRQQGVVLIYQSPIPELIQEEVTDYFFSQVLAFIQPVQLVPDTSFFPQNNKLYLLIQVLNTRKEEELWVVNIPSDMLPRFFTVEKGGQQYIVFLDDIIRFGFDKFNRQVKLRGTFSFKITRDAEIDYQDEYAEELAAGLEKQLEKRDLGLATRFLYQPGIPLRVLYLLQQLLGLPGGGLVEGGTYHNLKDLAGLPVKQSGLLYPAWPGVSYQDVQRAPSLLDKVAHRDLIFHAPYQAYNTILRFFNEAAIRPEVTEIYVTLYRVAKDSRIANALISAAKNGKRVQVMVELKARFDEANNIKWSKKMKAAGIRLVYSPASLKVHAKVALVKLYTGGRMHYRGLLATGNFNETTAAFYTDHILLTANPLLLREVELLFIFLAQKHKQVNAGAITFEHLFVAQFNLQQAFLGLIDEQIAEARQGRPARIIIKLNNLEEETLIARLYEASEAGVDISLIVRSICCLKPGVPGMSSNIRVTRIVDRYLEHGRVFIFGAGQPKVYLGSADWMNRNIYHRIEVCFPVYDEGIRTELLKLIDLQLADNMQAVVLDEHLQNVAIEPQGLMPVRSQQQIYDFLRANAT